MTVRQRGQALVETAMITPLIILLALGTYDVSIFASNQVQGTTAARNGARTGALLGGKGGANQNTCKGSILSTFNPADTDSDGDGAQDAIDASIVQTVLRGTANMTYVTITEIDVYSPLHNASGVLWTGSTPDPINRYTGSGAEMRSGASEIAPTFNLTSQRCQGPLGSESELGVRVVWNYTPVNRIIGININNLSDYAVEKLAYCDPACHQ